MKQCEKCGEEISDILIGDEFHAYCRKCDWTTN